MVLSEQQKLKIIRLAAKDIYSKSFIAKSVGCSIYAVTTTLRKSDPRTSNIPTIQNKRRKGSYKLTSQQECNMLEFIKNNNKATLEEIRVGSGLTHIKSKDTIRMNLKRLGVKNYRTKLVPFINLANKVIRYDLFTNIISIFNL